MKLLIKIVAINCMLIIASVAHATVLIFEENFANAVTDWAATTVSTQSSGTLILSQGMMSGNPDNYLAGTHMYGTGASRFSAILSGMPVTTNTIGTNRIKYSADFRIFSNDGGSSDPNLSIGFALQQDGKTYLALAMPLLPNAAVSRGWESRVLADLVESDFAELDGSGPNFLGFDTNSNPDFSDLASAVSFGVVVANNNTSPSDDERILTTEWGLDNFKVELTPIPVPAAAWLFMSGLIGLVWKGRKAHQSIA